MIKFCYYYAAPYPTCNIEVPYMAYHPTLAADPLPPLAFPLQPYVPPPPPARHGRRRSAFGSGYQRSGWTPSKIAGLIIICTVFILVMLFLIMSFAMVGVRYVSQLCDYLRKKRKEGRGEGGGDDESSPDPWTTKVMYPIKKETNVN